MTELIIDPVRVSELKDLSTGIFVRAKNSEGRWVSVDIIFLDKDSLLAWLRSRDGYNPWAEDVVGILLGHGNLTASNKGHLK